MRPQVISFHCVIKNKLGQVLSSSFNQDVINQRDHGNDRLPGLVEGLQSVKTGERRNFEVPATRAYGIYEPSLVLELKLSELEYANRLTLGSQILRGKQVFRVIRLDSESVVIDGNHPFAGHDLVFEVEITSAREAKADDILDASLPIPGQLIH